MPSYKKGPAAKASYPKASFGSFNRSAPKARSRGRGNPHRMKMSMKTMKMPKMSRRGY